MTPQRQKIPFLSFLSRECMSKYFFRKYFSCMQGQYKYRQKCIYLQFLVVTYGKGFELCYRRCLNGSGLFPLFKQFLDTKMTKSPPIIVKE